jgi:hypothetical protein
MPRALFTKEVQDELMLLKDRSASIAATASLTLGGCVISADQPFHSIMSGVLSELYQSHQSHW